MKLRYIMLLQYKKHDEEKVYHKAVRLPECEDDSTNFLYEVLSYFAKNNWVNLCGVIPSFDCGCLSEKEIELWKNDLVEYEDLFQKK